MSQWSHYSAPDLEWAKVAAQLPIYPLTCDEIPSRRIALNEMKRQAVEKSDYPKVDLSVNERSIPVTGGDILIRTYVPEGVDNESFPVLVDIHGGGYAFGDLNNGEVKCREACVNHRLSVVNVGYRLAPEHPWPTGINDSYDALKWVVNNLSEIKGDISKGFLLLGASAGANFVCILTQRARNDPLLRGKITGQILQIPHTCWSDEKGTLPSKFSSLLHSREENKNDPILSSAFQLAFLEAYKPGSIDNPEVSPLMAETFANLPPAFFQIAGADPLRDDGLMYEQFLRETNIPTKVEIYPGVAHGFAGFAPHIKAAIKWKADVDKGIRWLLSLDQSKA